MNNEDYKSQFNSREITKLAQQTSDRHDLGLVFEDEPVSFAREQSAFMIGLFNGDDQGVEEEPTYAQDLVDGVFRNARARGARQEQGDDASWPRFPTAAQRKADRSFGLGRGEDVQTDDDSQDRGRRFGFGLGRRGERNGFGLRRGGATSDFQSGDDAASNADDEQ